MQVRGLSMEDEEIQDWAELPAAPPGIDVQVWQNYERLCHTHLHRIPHTAREVIAHFDGRYKLGSCMSEQMAAAEFIWQISGQQPTQLLPDDCAAPPDAHAEGDTSSRLAAPRGCTTPGAGQQQGARDQASPSKRGRKRRSRDRAQHCRTESREHSNLALEPVREHSAESYTRHGKQKPGSWSASGAGKTRQFQQPDACAAAASSSHSDCAQQSSMYMDDGAAPSRDAVGHEPGVILMHSDHWPSWLSPQT